ncbi:MAG: cell division protein ZapA [Sphingopyxis sp.]|nr:cell division protein ZapA [Sphingopyxis sp.]
MGDVRLSICGRLYDVHCADGQEAQLEKLAGLVEAKARTVNGGTEVRQLLFAALMLADEAQETQAKVANSPAVPPQADLAPALKAAEAREQAALARIAELEAAAGLTAAPSPAMTRALEQIAERIEALADQVAV